MYKTYLEEKERARKEKSNDQLNEPKYSYKERTVEEKRPAAMAKGSARVKQYTSVRNTTLTESYGRNRSNS